MIEDNNIAENVKLSWR